MENFEECWSKFYPSVFRRVAYLTGNIHAAEDISQEVFAKLYNSPPAHANIEAWLMRVAANLAYNFLRDEKKRRSKGTAIEDEYDNVISIEDIAIKNAEVRLIKKVLDAMNPRDRLCLLLKFSGYRYNEIAEIAGMEKTSVGQTLARAQAKFRECYLKEAEKL